MVDDLALPPGLRVRLVQPGARAAISPKARMRKRRGERASAPLTPAGRAMAGSEQRWRPE